MRHGNRSCGFSSRTSLMAASGDWSAASPSRCCRAWWSNPWAHPHRKTGTSAGRYFHVNTRTSADGTSGSLREDRLVWWRDSGDEATRSRSEYGQGDKEKGRHGDQDSASRSCLGLRVSPSPCLLVYFFGSASGGRAAFISVPFVPLYTRTTPSSQPLA